jgi:hypothetical protein
MVMRGTALVAVMIAVAAAAVSALPAWAHEERPASAPVGENGAVPVYNAGSSGQLLIVCHRKAPADFDNRVKDYPPALKAQNQALYEQCRKSRTGFDKLQDAVDWLRANGPTGTRTDPTRVEILPGVYTEPGSTDPPPPGSECSQDKYNQDPHTHYVTYDEQKACPHAQNLVAILGDKDPHDTTQDCPSHLCNLQIEGTGAAPGDVIFDADYKKPNVIRADRVRGIYFRNLTIQRSTFNSLYIMESDGFAIDAVVGRWNDEYGFLTFVDDHGLYQNCEAYTNGDSGLYPGAGRDLNRDGTQPEQFIRFAIEVRDCYSHDNNLGYSGTAGDSIWVHDNDFSHNQTGASMDSAFPNHPGLPQNHALFEHNRIYSNNSNYYHYVRDGTCDRDPKDRGYENGVVCPSVGVPVGVGVLLAGGNYNLYPQNWIYDNWRYGTMQFWVPAIYRYSPGDTAPPTLDQYDTSNYNTYRSNFMGAAPTGQGLPNGTDFWWDEEGKGNCWESNAGANGAHVTSDPANLPDCSHRAQETQQPNPAKTLTIATCAFYDRSSPVFRNEIPPCTWFDSPARPANARGASGGSASSGGANAAASSGSLPFTGGAKMLTVAAPAGGAGAGLLVLLLAALVLRRRRA